MAKAHRLLLLLPDLALGGAQRVLLQLAALFAAAGREVHVASLLDVGPLRAEIPAGVRYHGLVGQARDAILFWRALPRLRQLLRALAPEALLSSVTGTNLLAAFARDAFAGRLVLREAAAFANIRQPLRKLFVHALYPRADAWVAVSEGVARDLATLGLAREHIAVIPNPVDAGRLRALARAAPECPHVPKPYLIAVGRLVPQKGHDVLLQAYAQSALRATHALLIVGEGPQRRALEEQIRLLKIEDRVVLAGELPNPYPLLAGAALLVHASRWEGYSNVLLEALALGVPVVASDCPHSPADILAGGRYGRLVPVDDIAALGRAMEEELARACGSAEQVIAAHRPEAIAAQYLRVLDGQS
jgi:glycosyltransferase involved in cell wall biosynthesis